MPFVTVPTESAIRVRRPAGSKVKFLNQSAVDVFLDTEPSRLNWGQPGSLTTNNGSKLAANGGEVEFDNYPCGGIWFRSNIYTSIEVQP